MASSSDVNSDWRTAAMEFMRRLSGRSLSSSTVTTPFATAREVNAKEENERFRNLPPIMSKLDRDEWPRFNSRKVGPRDRGLKNVTGNSQLEVITEVEEEEEEEDEADHA